MAEKRIIDGAKPVKLEELIEVAKKNIEGTITEDELNKFGAKLIIRPYVPISEKTATIISILTNYLYDDTEIFELQIEELYKNIFFYGLLGLYGYVDCSNIELITLENYDLLYPLFGEFIKNYCERDFNTFKDMLHDAINFYTIKDFQEVGNNFSSEALDKAAKSNQELIDTLDKKSDVVKQLYEIAVMNDPATHEVVKSIYDAKHNI